DLYAEPAQPFVHGFNPPAPLGPICQKRTPDGNRFERPYSALAQHNTCRLGKRLYDEIRSRRMLIAVAEINEDRAATSRTSSLDVAGPIANHEAPRAIDPELRRGTAQHAG